MIRFQLYLTVAFDLDSFLPFFVYVYNLKSTGQVLMQFYPISIPYGSISRINVGIFDLELRS